MKLICSRGHAFDTHDIEQRVAYGDNRLVVNGRCPMLMSYDRLNGSTYCGRLLKPSKDNLAKLKETAKQDYANGGYVGLTISRHTRPHAKA